MCRIWMAAAAALFLVGTASAHEQEGAGAAIMLAGPTILTQGRTVVPLRLRLDTAPTRRSELAIEGLDFDVPPRVLYRVWLQGPDGRLAPLGVINFYNETAPGRDVRARTIRFDATEALRQLGGRATAIVFEPSAGVTGVAARVDPRAHVRFDTIAIRQR